MIQYMQDPPPILVPCGLRLFPDPFQAVRFNVQTAEHMLIRIDRGLSAHDLSTFQTSYFTSQNLASLDRFLIVIEQVRNQD
jgi:hypothetical protein